MSDEAALRDKLRKIEASFTGAITACEKTAAGAAAERIRARLREEETREKPVEIRFSVPDPWTCSELQWARPPLDAAADVPGQESRIAAVGGPASYPVTLWTGYGGD